MPQKEPRMGARQGLAEHGTCFSTSMAGRRLDSEWARDRVHQADDPAQCSQSQISCSQDSLISLKGLKTLKSFTGFYPLILKVKTQNVLKYSFNNLFRGVEFPGFESHFCHLVSAQYELLLVSVQQVLNTDLSLIFISEVQYLESLTIGFKPVPQFQQGALYVNIVAV